MAPRLQYEIPDLYDHADIFSDAALDIHRPAVWALLDRLKLQQRWRYWSERNAARRFQMWNPNDPDSAARVLNFGRSVLNSEYGDEDGWECVDILGRGAFGLVGRWDRFDFWGNKIDTLAVKEGAQHDMQMTPRHALGFPEYPVPMEAFILVQLMKLRSDHIVQIRGLKAYALTDQWRFYLEFCQNGDLWRMTEKYISSNARYGTSQRFPELFIWYAFHSLADAACKMGGIDPDDSSKFLLHLDLKDANVMLGDVTDEHWQDVPFPLPAMPTLKIGDWGSAAVTSLFDPLNSATMYGDCTVPWRPPEHRHHNSWSQSWISPMLNHPSQRVYTESHTIFSIGCLIYGLVVLQVNNRSIDELLDRFMTDEILAYRRGHALPDSDLEWNGIYSRKLFDLLRRCVRLRPEQRITPQELFDETKAGMEAEKIKTVREPLAAGGGTAVPPEPIAFGDDADQILRNLRNAEVAARTRLCESIRSRFGMFHG